MEKKKGRKHSLCERNAVLAMILTVLLGFLTQFVSQIPGSVGAIIISSVIFGPLHMTNIFAGRILS